MGFQIQNSDGWPNGEWELEPLPEQVQPPVQPLLPGPQLPGLLPPGQPLLGPQPPLPGQPLLPGLPQPALPELPVQGVQLGQQLPAAPAALGSQELPQVRCAY